MSAHRINAKLFFSRFDVEVEQFVPIFHNWIRDHAVQGLLIDVADYKHVPNGPAIMLVGHDVEYVIDFADGEPSFLITGKRQWPTEDLTGRLVFLFERIIQASKVLLLDERVNGRLQVDTSRIQIEIPDRLRYPNNEETYSEIETAVQTAFTTIFPTSDTILSFVETDKRKPLTVQATTLNTFDSVAANDAATAIAA